MWIAIEIKGLSDGLVRVRDLDRNIDDLESMPNGTATLLDTASILRGIQRAVMRGDYGLTRGGLGLRLVNEGIRRMKETQG